jgi:hypothetical protein
MSGKGDIQWPDKLAEQERKKVRIEVTGNIRTFHRCQDVYTGQHGRLNRSNQNNWRHLDSRAHTGYK